MPMLAEVDGEAVKSDAKDKQTQGMSKSQPCFSGVLASLLCLGVAQSAAAAVLPALPEGSASGCAAAATVLASCHGSPQGNYTPALPSGCGT